MTIPQLTHTQFLELLKTNGWEVVNGEYWEDYNRIIMQKDGHTFPLQYKEVYHYPFVVKTCLSLGITPPADHLKCYRQQADINKSSDKPHAADSPSSE